MSLTFLEIEVGNPADPKKTQALEFFVDSGAIYSVVPTPVLKKLGIKPIAKEEVILANGEKIARKKGVALFKYAGKVGGADVIFGEPEDSTLLEAFTLSRFAKELRLS